MVQLLQQGKDSIINDKVYYTEEDDAMWQKLYKKQIELLNNRVHDQFFELLDELNLNKDRVPQLYEVSNTLQNKTGWTLTRVDGLIPYNDFFSLLANKVFPSTVYLRTLDKFSKDPDIFHELFGHCPMLLNPSYSNFLNNLAKFALKCSRLEQILLQRLLWFTIEVGLIQTKDGLKIYGGALISSPQESVYVLEKNESEKKEFDLLDIFRSPYRADVLQTTYYFIKNLDDLYHIKLSHQKLSDLAKTATQLGEYPAKFRVEYNKYTSVHCF